MHTFDVRSGETYTLRVAETFFGDISGRFGNLASRGDSGNGTDDMTKKNTSEKSLTNPAFEQYLLISVHQYIPSAAVFSSLFLFGLVQGPRSTNRGLTVGMKTSL